MVRRDVIRTRAKIMDAYIRLNAREPVSRMTVKELLSEADVSRSTFYAHFRDIYDLRDAVTKDFEQGCMDALNDGLGAIRHDPYQAIRSIFRYFDQHAGASGMRPDDELNLAFFQRFKETLARALDGRNHLDDDHTALSLQSLCIASIVVEGCSQILLRENTESPLDPNEAAKIVASMVTASIDKPSGKDCPQPASAR